MDNSKGKKQIPLRLSAKLWEEISQWAEEEFRSVNGQIEYLLSDCVKDRKKGRGPAPSAKKEKDE